MRGIGTPAFPPCRRLASRRAWHRRPAPRPSRPDLRMGQWLRHWRLERGLSQEELAAGVGVTVAQLDDHERGLARIAPQDLVAYARFLGISLGAFLG